MADAYSTSNKVKKDDDMEMITNPLGSSRTMSGKSASIGGAKDRAAGAFPRSASSSPAGDVEEAGSRPYHLPKSDLEAGDGPPLPPPPYLGDLQLDTCLGFIEECINVVWVPKEGEGVKFDDKQEMEGSWVEFKQSAATKKWEQRPPFKAKNMSNDFKLKYPASDKKYKAIYQRLDLYSFPPDYLIDFDVLNPKTKEKGDGYCSNYKMPWRKSKQL